MNYFFPYRLSCLLMVIVLLGSCQDDFLDDPEPVVLLPESTTTVPGKQVLKVLPHPGGWVSLAETIQPQFIITAPRRELTWMSGNFGTTSKYTPPDGWFLLDGVVHPSGHVSAALISVDVKRPEMLRIKIVRFNNGGTQHEIELAPLPREGERTKYFPGSLDRVSLNAAGEDLYVVARWQYNEVEASKISFTAGLFHVDWQQVVEPDSYCGVYGIIGGGYDNFRQGDRYFFVYSGVDSQGHLYVAVNSHEDLLLSHDLWFGENLSAGADPSTYDYGVAILTKMRPDGQRMWSKLEGMSTRKRLLNLSVSDDVVYLSGRVKINDQGNGWDAWILAADAANGSVRYEANVDIKDGDMFWDIEPLPGGRALAVGTLSYTQNPAGLSVSDVRFATAVVLDGKGTVVRQIELPQGPAHRGSEAMYVRLLGGNTIVVTGAHNAPGTHAEVYSDGFIHIQRFDIEE